VNIRPKPGQTELNWREWLLLLGIIVVAVVICVYGGRAVVRNFAAAPATPTATATHIRPTVTLAVSPTPVPPTATPTPNIPAAISKGIYVAVTDAVNFRQDASTTAQIIRTLGAGEVLQVTSVGRQSHVVEVERSQRRGRLGGARLHHAHRAAAVRSRTSLPSYPT